MGAIVGGYATSHTMFPSTGVESQAAAVVAGFEEIGDRVRESGADIVVLVSSEHGPTLPPSGPQPPFVVGTGETIRTFGEMGIPKTSFSGHPDFARGFVRHAAAAGFDLAMIERFQADHGTAIPVLKMFPKLDVPIVPVIVNSLVAEATATAARCHQLGQVLADYAGSRAERVAVIGCGGLSHWPGTPEMGRINEDFDREFLALLESGGGAHAASWTTDYILENAGNGGLEIRNWILVSGAVGDQPGRSLYYEPIPQWVTGMGAFEFNVSAV
ncbi:hypothetical protein CFH99_00810 [Nocardioides aromaticivorans]|uniref:Large subunit of meta-cleavage enzyme n=1 Tax=Nocardioides aromaticivorans TaxID=200618 RepID=Q2HWH7_9ACTN|nr:hypothetical protein [Nocardioides aromaticivorans]QSR24163.1 hypothetical protein CFH99_00810 [Nocardioides aromaticivorans]BAE79501.1 large subunit of meta-cleavage enzyme [Nocardioides aromaticivorans]